MCPAAVDRTERFPARIKCDAPEKPAPSGARSPPPAEPYPPSPRSAPPLAEWTRDAGQEDVERFVPFRVGARGAQVGKALHAVAQVEPANTSDAEVAGEGDHLGAAHTVPRMHADGLTTALTLQFGWCFCSCWDRQLHQLSAIRP